MNDSGGNLLISAHSISLALAMAYAGARGDTERQMAETLHFDLPQDQLHSAFNALDLLLTSQIREERDGFILNVAISLWAGESYGFLPDYLDTLALNYGEEVKPLDLRRDPKAARASINDWVADGTGGTDHEADFARRHHRPHSAGAGQRHPLRGSPAQAPLTSAPPRTGLFHLLDSSERKVPMMRQQSNLRYAASDGYQAVALPYKGGEMAMTILLPDSRRFLEFEESLSGGSVEAILDSLDYELVRLTMPGSRWNLPSACPTL